MSYLEYLIAVADYLRRKNKRPIGYYDRFVCEYMSNVVGDDYLDVTPSTMAEELDTFLKRAERMPESEQVLPVFIPVHDIGRLVPSLN